MVTPDPEGEEGQPEGEEVSHEALEEEFPFHPDLFSPTKGKRNSAEVTLSSLRDQLLQEQRAEDDLVQ